MDLALFTCTVSLCESGELTARNGASSLVHYECAARIHHPSVGGITVRIVAFQAIDPGSTPGRRSQLFSFSLGRILAPAPRAPDPQLKSTSLFLSRCVDAQIFFLFKQMGCFQSELDPPPPPRWSDSRLLQVYGTSAPRPWTRQSAGTWICLRAVHHATHRRDGTACVMYHVGITKLCRVLFCPG